MHMQYCLWTAGFKIHVIHDVETEHKHFFSLLLLQLVSVSDSIFHHLLFDSCSADRQDVKCVAGGGGSHPFARWGSPAPSGETMCLMCDAGLSCWRLCLRLLMSRQTLMRHKGWWEGKPWGNWAFSALWEVMRQRRADGVFTCHQSVRWSLVTGGFSSIYVWHQHDVTL